MSAWPLALQTFGPLALSSLAPLKMAQEVITLLVFEPFAVLYMQQPMKLDDLSAALCLMGAVSFTLRG